MKNHSNSAPASANPFPKQNTAQTLISKVLNKFQPLTRPCQFNDIPRELRDMIWKLALPNPRIVHLERNPLKYYGNTKRVWSNVPISDNRSRGYPSFIQHDRIHSDETYDFKARLTKRTKLEHEHSSAYWGFKSQSPPPNLLLICRESHAIASLHYSRAFGTQYAFGETWFDFKRDTLYLDFGWLQRTDIVRKDFIGEHLIEGRLYRLEDISSSDIQQVQNIFTPLGPSNMMHHPPNQPPQEDYIFDHFLALRYWTIGDIGHSIGADCSNLVFHNHMDEVLEDAFLRDLRKRSHVWRECGDRDLAAAMGLELWFSLWRIVEVWRELPQYRERENLEANEEMESGDCLKVDLKLCVTKEVKEQLDELDRGFVRGGWGTMEGRYNFDGWHERFCLECRYTRWGVFGKLFGKIANLLKWTGDGGKE